MPAEGSSPHRRKYRPSAGDKAFLQPSVHESRLHFRHQPRFLVFMARGEMERLDPTCPGSAGDFAGGLGRQMRPFPRAAWLVGGERGLEEHHLRVGKQPRERRPIGRRVAQVRGIADLRSARDADEIAKRSEGGA